MTNILDEAVKLGKEGFAVIPLHRFFPAASLYFEESGRTIFHPASCTCENGVTCGSMGKHPACKINSACTEEKSIRKLFRQFSPNLGTILGKSYHCAIDVDERNGGFESLPRLMHDCGITSFEDHRMAMSGSGSLHIIFACWVEKIRSGALKGYPGIDVKGSFGNDTVLVCPPSNHKSGGFYRWIHRVPAIDAPDSLLDIMVRNHVDKEFIGSKKIKTDRAMIISPLRLIPDWPHTILHSGLNGAHPVHGSSGGKNFFIFPDTGLWHCFRCGSKGGLLELAAQLADFRVCDDFKDGAYLSLTKNERVMAIDECLNRGISHEDLVKFETKVFRVKK